MSVTERIIVLVDMDCFYCQVEQKLNPSLVGKPLAVVQYNAWKGGGLIAVNYEARAKGVTRHMRGDDAKAICPEIELARVPQVRNKADLTRYRDAGKQVADVLQTFTPLLERASVDEAYLDITEAVNAKLENFAVKVEELQNSHVVGYEHVADFLKEISCEGYLNDGNVKLAIGGVITEEIRAAVYAKTGYRCSAGIAHNKVLAKLTCGLHKPNQQTILPHEGVHKLYENLSLKKIRSMGGKFGDEVMQKLDVTLMADLVKFTERELQQHFEEKTANWLYNIARGINNEPVTVRLVSKSIGCCKRFPGRTALKNEESVRHWTHELSTEIAERIEKDIAENNRKPRQLIVSYSQQVGRKDVSSTRSQALNTTEQEKLYQEAYEVVRKNCQRSDGSFMIKFLGLNVSKFEDIKQVTDIASMFKNASKRNSSSSTNISSSKHEEELDQLSKDIHSVIQEGLELNKSINNSESDEKEKSVELKSRQPVIQIFASTSKVIDKSNVEIVESDDSSSELEAINASIQESQNSLLSTGKNSFFHKFLQPTNGTPKRDFNTSAILDETIENEEQKVDESERVSPIIGVKSEKPQKSTILTMFSNSNTSSPGTNKKSYITDDNKELCLECNKLIPVENIVSHMDYHFSIQMVREEAHLYKSQPVVNKSEVISTESEAKTKGTVKNTTQSKVLNNNNKPANNTKNLGRKRKSQANLEDISNFFVKTRDGVATDENTEVCPNCSKRIKYDEMASHLDYHVAKTLHQEINDKLGESVRNDYNSGATQQGGGSKVMNGNCDKRALRRNGVDLNKKGTITTYFKQL